MYLRCRLTFGQSKASCTQAVVWSHNIAPVDYLSIYLCMAQLLHGGDSEVFSQTPYESDQLWPVPLDAIRVIFTTRREMEHYMAAQIVCSCRDYVLSGT